MTGRSILFVFLACATANALWAALGNSDWDTAIERSWFQGAALTMAWLGGWGSRP
jgi:hypothetical protein